MEVFALSPSHNLLSPHMEWPGPNAGWSALLDAHFDGVLVHADPAFVRFEAHFARAAELPVPWRYTGFVGVPPSPRWATSTESYAVLSCGGPAAMPFLRAAVSGFRRAAVGDMRLLVFPDPETAAAGGDVLAVAGDDRVGVCGFTSEFASRLAGSALSVSRAGYLDPTVDLLHAGVPAVVVPDPRMSDQHARARRLAELGIATMVEGDPPSPEAIAAGSRGRSGRHGHAAARPGRRGDHADAAGAAGHRKRRRMALDGYVRVTKLAALGDPERLLDALAALEGEPRALADDLRRHHLLGLVRARVSDAVLQTRLPAEVVAALLAAGGRSDACRRASSCGRTTSSAGRWRRATSTCSRSRGSCSRSGSTVGSIGVPSTTSMCACRPATFARRSV